MSLSDDCWLYGHKQGDGQTRTSNTTVKDKVLEPSTNKLIDAKPINTELTPLPYSCISLSACTHAYQPDRMYPRI